MQVHGTLSADQAPPRERTRTASLTEVTRADRFGRRQSSKAQRMFTPAVGELFRSREMRPSTISMKNRRRRS
jgi:hypothetical protein